MEEKQLSELTDQELLAKAKEHKSSAITHAVIIGFLVGIIVFSVAVNSVGFLTLIPLYLIYKFVGDGKHDKAVKEELRARNLS